MTGPGRYVEPGRSWWALGFPALLLGVGVGLDAGFGHLHTHVIGWIAAAVLVIGGDALLIRAGRVFKTLTVDAEQIRVGDEAVPVADIVSAAPSTQVETDGTEPMLGWAGRPPRRRPYVLLERTDGRRVLVPTRNPAAVLNQLGVAAPTPATVVVVRPAEPADLPLLAEIDERAEVLFTVAGLPLPELPEARYEPGAVFVAGTPPVGFAQVDVVDGTAHLSEVSVLPGSMRQGIGSRLIEAACDWARSAGHTEMTLTTFAEVPWNGPLYARRGWVESNTLGPELAAIRASEIDGGLDDVGRRVVMRRPLRPDSASGQAVGDRL